MEEAAGYAAKPVDATAVRVRPMAVRKRKTE
jgi:hypothetical protein